MRRNFVLDENVVIYAYKGEDEEGNPDPTCANLLLGIVRNGHVLVVHSAFWGLWSGQINRARLERIPLNPGILAQLTRLLLDPTRAHHITDEDFSQIEGLDALPNPDENDRLFICAAAAVSGSILATTDRPMMDDVRGAGIDARYGFQILHPRDALPLAQPANNS